MDKATTAMKRSQTRSEHCVHVSKDDGRRWTALSYLFVSGATSLGRGAAVLLFFAVIILLRSFYPAAVLADYPQNVKEAIDVIVLFCVAGGEEYQISGALNVEGGLALKKAGVTAGAEIQISKSDARGLVEGLRHEMSMITGEQATQARNCMQPYIDRIVNILLPPESKHVPQLYLSPIGASYELECVDNKEGKIFTAIIQFTSEYEVRWRYQSYLPWNEESFRIEQLSPHRFVLSVNKKDLSKPRWDLEFYDNYRKVKGTFHFLQNNPTRWRNYVVAGSRIE